MDAGPAAAAKKLHPTHKKSHTSLNTDETCFKFSGKESWNWMVFLQVDGLVAEIVQNCAHFVQTWF